jgi:hypothetical protein
LRFSSLKLQTGQASLTGTSGKAGERVVWLAAWSRRDSRRARGESRMPMNHQLYTIDSSCFSDVKRFNM